MKLDYLGHSCFKIESNEFSIVFDPYAPGSVPGLKDLNVSANLVLCSHKHGDHSCVEAVKIKTSYFNPYKIAQIKCYHDEVLGQKRGSNIIHVVENENLKIVHLGDLGHEIDDELMKELENTDVLLIPVGGHYTIDAATAKKIVDKMNPGCVIPMHYRSSKSGYDEIDVVDSFLSYFEEVEYLNESLIVTKDLPKVIVMNQIMTF